MLLILHSTVCSGQKHARAKVLAKISIVQKSCKIPKSYRDSYLACCRCKKFGHFSITSEKCGYGKCEPWIFENCEFQKFWILLTFQISHLAVWGLLIAFVTSVPSFDELFLLMHMNEIKKLIQMAIFYISRKQFWVNSFKSYPQNIFYPQYLYTQWLKNDIIEFAPLLIHQSVVCHNYPFPCVSRDTSGELGGCSWGEGGFIQQQTQKTQRKQ